MARLNAANKIRKYISDKEEVISINWINFPEYLVKQNKNIIFELRQELYDNGYRRKDVPEEQQADVRCGYPQEEWYLVKQEVVETADLKSYEVCYEWLGEISRTVVKAENPLMAKKLFRETHSDPILRIQEARLNTASMCLSNTMSLQISIPEGQHDVVEYRYSDITRWRKANIQYDTSDWTGDEPQPYFQVRNVYYYISSFVRDNI